MRKMILTLLSIFVSVGVNANPLETTHDLSTAINKTLEKQSSNNHSSSIVYGGKDISRSIVAAAHESTWKKRHILVA